MNHFKASGFTMTEMMFVVAILGILAAFAAPAMLDMVVLQRLKNASFDLVADIILARSEAIKRTAAVQITPVSSNWANGWTVTSGGNTIRSRGTLGSKVTVLSAPTSVTFDVNGRVSSTATTIKFSLVPAGSTTSAQGRCISVDPSGRPKTAMGNC